MGSIGEEEEPPVPAESSKGGGLYCSVCGAGIPAGRQKCLGLFLFCRFCFAGLRARDRLVCATKEQLKADRRRLQNDAEAWIEEIKPFSKSAALTNTDRQKARRDCQIKQVNRCTRQFTDYCLVGPSCSNGSQDRPRLPMCPKTGQDALGWPTLLIAQDGFLNFKMAQDGLRCYSIAEDGPSVFVLVGTTSSPKMAKHVRGLFWRCFEKGLEVMPKCVSTCIVVGGHVGAIAVHAL